MLPVLAPLSNVAVNGLFCPQTWNAALIPCSQRPFDTLIVAPAVAGVIVNLTPLDWPTVDVGLPWHFWIAPAMLPQIWSCATLEVVKR